MKRQTWTAAAALLSLPLAASACGQAVPDSAQAGQPTYNWDFTITTGSTSTWYEGAELFAKTVREKSGGRMRVDIFTSEQLSAGDPAAGVEQLISGEKEFSYNSTIIYAGLDPRFGAINAPFLYSNFAEAEQALDSGARAAYERLAASKGVKMLGFGESGFRQLTNSVRPVQEPADMEGIKIRIPGIGLFTDVFQSLGANPTTMNFSEVFTSLQQGTIEGQENPVDIVYSAGLSEVQRHLTVWNYVYDPLILGMNKDLFDSLPERDQQIVLEAAAKANALQIRRNRAKEAAELKELSKTMRVTRLSPGQMQTFRRTMAPLYAQYRGIWGPRLAEIVQPSAGEKVRSHG